MRYKVIIFDIDGTITSHVSSWRYIHEKLNIWDDLACVYQKKFLAGKISYKKFCELDAAHWKGLPEKNIKQIFNKLPYTKNSASCIKKLKEMGFKLIALSTGLQYLADRIKNDLQFDYVLSNKLLSKNGVLTGKVKVNIAHGAKEKILHKILSGLRVKPSELISIGDSAGDISLARLSGYSIAFNSSDKKFSNMVDYNCKTRDFKEVYNKIIEISK